MLTKSILIIRDTFILFVLSFFGGFIVGISGEEGSRYVIAIGISNIIFSTIGFTISGCMAKNNRFKHLLSVAVAYWYIGLFNIFFGYTSFYYWLFGLFFILISMVIGGLISFLFVKPDSISNINAV